MIFFPFRNYQQQSNCYSNYKSHTTAKILIACHPNGACVYCSPVFEGGISDKESVLNSGFMDYIEHGDIYMADRGFQNMKEDFLMKGATLITPPSMKDKTSLSLEDEKKTRSVAAARIHIERFNQRVKIFQFVSPGVFPQSKLKLLNQAVYVCCYLANYSPILVE